MFQKTFLPLIQRNTRVTRTAATAIDHIITDAILGSTMHSGIIKANIYDLFPIFAILENSSNINKNYEKAKITKSDFSHENIQNLQFFLGNIKWGQLLPSNVPNEAYNIFLKKVSDLYDVAFPKKEIEIKSKYLNTPWITKEIRKSSKRKQHPYKKYLQIRSKENEKTYKTYKNLFERLKKNKNAKKNYYLDKTKLFENDIQNTWKVIKEIIGKKKCNNETLPKHLIVDKIEIHDGKCVAEKFNEFFVNIGPNFANKIPQCDLIFKSYLPIVTTTLKKTVLSEN